MSNRWDLCMQATGRMRKNLDNNLEEIGKRVENDEQNK